MQKNLEPKLHTGRGNRYETTTISSLPIAVRLWFQTHVKYTSTKQPYLQKRFDLEEGFPPLKTNSGGVLTSGPSCAQDKG